VNSGDFWLLYVGDTLPSNKSLRSYLQFDVTLIPSSAVILNAYMGLNNSACYSGTSDPVGVYRVNGIWDEATIAWGTQPPMEITTGSIVTLPATATHTFVYWDIRALVQGGVEHSIANNGVVIKDTDESTNEGERVFISSDWTVSANDRPKLVIDYYDPTL
jgi:hypothetical protein